MARIKIKGNVYDDNICKFINYLADKYPVPVPLTFNLVKKTSLKTKKGTGCIGFITLVRDATEVPVKIAAVEAPGLFREGAVKALLKTIAHEYCHAIQCYVYGQRPGEGYNSHPDHWFEKPAWWFQEVELEAALKEGVIAL